MNKAIKGLMITSLLTLQLSTAAFCQGDTLQTITPNLSDTTGHWSKVYIDELYGRGIVKGYPDGTFKPEGSVTVAEFTKMLMINCGITLGNEGTSWYEPYIGGATNKGIILNGEYNNVDRPLTRGEATVMIDRFLGKDIMTNNLKFNDEYYMSTSQRRSIYDIVNQGIMKGYPDGTFRPNGDITRAEACAIISNLNHLDTLTVSKDIPTSHWTDEEYDKFWTDKELYQKAVDWIANSKDQYRFTHSYHAGFSLNENGGIQYDDIGPDVHHFDFENYEESKWIKPLADDLLKELLYYANERGHYVDLRTRDDFDVDFFQILYYAHPDDTVQGPNVFRVDLWKDNPEDEFSIPYDLTIQLGEFAPYRTGDYTFEGTEEYYEKLKKDQYTFTEFLEPMKYTFIKIFGEEDGTKFYNYAINEYRIKKADEKLLTYKKSKYYFNIGDYRVEQFDIFDDVSKQFMYTIYQLDYKK